MSQMYWMTEGEWYHITFDEFATQFLYGQTDKDQFRIHIHNPLEENELSSYMPRDKNVMQGPSIDYTYFTQS
jgi:hypothetical protein